MIKRIMVRSLRWTKDFLRSPIAMHELESMTPPFAIISIRDVQDDTTRRCFEKRVWPEQSNEVLALYFEDDEFDFTKDEIPVDKFQRSQAEEILFFVNKLINSEKEYTLIVHCVAGLCRSAAVGEVIADMIKMPREEFVKENPNKFPNNSVRGLLRRVANNFC